MSNEFDGDLDLLVAGTSDGNASGGRTRLYRNNGGSFAGVLTALPNLGNSGFAWGDYDRDGDLDLALDGVDSTNVFRTATSSTERPVLHASDRTSSSRPEPRISR